ncbi:putative ATPases involved in chromosome partitioning-like [Gammaproteobacteria bacterium]
MSAIDEALHPAYEDSGKGTFCALSKNQQSDPLDPSGKALGGFSVQMTALYGAIRPILDGMERGAVIHFVAATGGEGTSTIAREFSFMTATSGHRRTLLVDGNAASLETALLFGCPTDRGIVDYVRDGVPYDAALRSLSHATLTIGALVGVGAGMHLDAKSVRATYADFRERYELTVVDCSSITAGLYSQLVPEAADGIVMVIQAEKVRPVVAQYAKGLVEQAGGNFLGAVLNKRRNYIPEFLYKHL